MESGGEVGAGVGDADCGGVMRARPRPGGWLLNGVRYSSEAAYLVALRKWEERRARILALFEADREEDEG